MSSGRLGLALLLGGIAATLGAVGCFTSSDNGSNAADDVHGGNGAGPLVSSNTEALKSTLILDAGCMAAKVGPRHLLLAARCVSGNKAFGPGQVLTFKVAAGAEGDTVAAPDVVDASLNDADPDADVADASVPDAAAIADASAPEASVTIATVTIHPSFVASCTSPSACAIGSAAIADVKDVAIVTLTEDLDTVPTIPVDLDAVGQSDPVLTVGSGCTGFDGKPSAVVTTPTIAVPAKAEAHFGSPFQNVSMTTLHELDQDYVITPGMGWRKDGPALCRGDIGAPLFRGDKNAVAGITAGFTTYDKRSNVPVTLQHTRVDAASQVGTWLQSLGATTVRSCNGACPAFSYDGGMPDISAPEGYDGGDVDGGVFTMPTQGTATDLGSDTNDGYSSSDPQYADMGTKKSSSGLACSATPGVGGGRMNACVPFLGIGLALAALRRRRR